MKTTDFLGCPLFGQTSGTMWEISLYPRQITHQFMIWGSNQKVVKAGWTYPNILVFLGILETHLLSSIGVALHMWMCALSCQRCSSLNISKRTPSQLRLAHIQAHLKGFTIRNQHLTSEMFVSQQHPVFLGKE